jgi:hypothetical protein
MWKLLISIALGLTLCTLGTAQGIAQEGTTPVQKNGPKPPVPLPPNFQLDVPDAELAAENSAIAADQLPDGFCQQEDFDIWTNAGLVPAEVFKTLMIVDRRVVDSGIAHKSRPWRFENALSNLAGGHDIGNFVYRWLSSFENTQNINGFSIPARAAIRTKFIDLWKRNQGIAPGPNTDAQWISSIDLTKAPVKLVAVVNRIDLAKIDRDPQSGQIARVENAGEGRLVYQVFDDKLADDKKARPFTIIFEYELRATTIEELQQWAAAWEDLINHKYGTPFNKKLANIVGRFAIRNPELDRPNNIALNQIRTNEIDLALPWQLREFRLGPDGFLSPSTVALTPDLSFNTDLKKRQALLNFTTNLTGTPIDQLLEFQVASGDLFTVPSFLRVDAKNTAFLGGSAETDISFLDTCVAGAPADKACSTKGKDKREDGVTWLVDAPGNDALPDLPARDPDRRWLSFNTCNGCHGGDGGDARNAAEKPNVSRGTLFTHIDLRKSGRKPPITEPVLPDVPDTVLSEFLCKNDLPLRRIGLIQMNTMSVSSLAAAFGFSITRFSKDQPSCNLKWNRDKEGDSTRWMGCYFKERLQRVH